MGITHKSIERLQRHNLLQKCSMLELGAQNIYTAEDYGEIAKHYFTNNWGIDHVSWDITPHQGAIETDLRNVIPVARQFDIVTDYGTSEHVNGNYYQVHKNIHNHCTAGGIIVHENPSTGHWPGHGCNYINKEFYEGLCKEAGYELIELQEEYAMGNTTDGKNICAVIRKVKDTKFISEEQFNSIGNVFSK
jgi:hypothetical protein